MKGWSRLTREGRSGRGSNPLFHCPLDVADFRSTDRLHRLPAYCHCSTTPLQPALHLQTRARRVSHLEELAPISSSSRAFSGAASPACK